ncbi:serine/threonine kinase [Aureococcus anophagefferens]|nr:serine/threonine kinase [Aureococcus anophagefferens]
MAAPENTSNGFPNTEVAGDMSVEAQDVRIRQYERLCENLKIQRRQYDSLKESLVEEAHRVGDVATGAARLGRCSGVFEGTWPDGRPCAVKRISKRDAKTRQEVRNVASELEALRLLSGAPHALELQAALASLDYLYFVVERFGEELYALLKRDETALTSAQQAGVVHGVAAGLPFK